MPRHPFEARRDHLTDREIAIADLRYELRNLSTCRSWRRQQLPVQGVLRDVMDTILVGSDQDAVASSRVRREGVDAALDGDGGVVSAVAIEDDEKHPLLPLSLGGSDDPVAPRTRLQVPELANVDRQLTLRKESGVGD